MSRVTPVARSLIRAFQEIDKESVEQLGVLMDDESLDVEAIRVLSAFMHSIVEWKSPAVKCPDRAQPTPRSWKWLWSGAHVDYLALADAANVGRSTAISKVAILIGARLIYPDGTVSNAARVAIQTALSSLSKRPKKQPKAKPKEGTEN